MRADLMQRLERLQLVINQRWGGRFLAHRRSTRVGAGLEFADYRPYAVGDDPRRLDWAAYARTNRLLVRQAHLEQEATVYLLLDASASMGYPEGKWNLVQEVAMALGYLSLAGMDRVMVGSFQNTLHKLSPAFMGKAQLHPLTDWITAVQPHALTAWGPSLQRFVRLAPTKGVVLVITDGYASDVVEGVRQLTMHGFETRILQLSDPAEYEQPLGQESEWVDAETGDTLSVAWNEVTQAAYQQAHRSYLKRWANAIRSQGVPLVQASPLWTVERIVLHALVRGGWLQ